MSNLRFLSSVAPAKFKQIVELSQSEPALAKKMGKYWSNKMVGFTIDGRFTRACCYETKTGDVVAGAIVTLHRAMSKEPSRGLPAAPDPTCFGVSTILGLHISHVCVHPNQEGDLLNRLLKRTIQSVEDELWQREMAKSPEKADSFKQMTTNSEGKVDQSLSEYFLSKKYFWFLYSGEAQAYEKLGFSPSILEGYRIPSSYKKSETTALVEKLLESAQDTSVGKSLRLLDKKNANDAEMLRLILQEIELEIVSQLNKSTFHSELSSGIRSSLSLTNVDNALSAVRLGSFNELTAISEQRFSSTIGEVPEETTGSRKSSAILLVVPRFSLLPDSAYLDAQYEYEAVFAENKCSSDYSSIQGAVLKNELQRKTFYVLWKIINEKQFHIIGMGELKMEGFATVDYLGGNIRMGEPVTRRRGSSFTGLNEMGGFNFQDLDLLLSTAVHVASKKSYLGKNNDVFVLVNDLPITVPTALLHDFFTNYMPQKLHEGPLNIEYVADFSKYKVIPMLKKFGTKSPKVETDWTRNSVLHW